MDYSGSYATPRADLGEALLEYRREGGGGWIGDMILVPISVMKQAATFSAIPRASILQNPDTARAARGHYNRISVGAKDKSYRCKNHGLEGLVDDSERALYRSDFDAEMATAMVVDRAVRLAREIRIKGKVFDAATWTGSDLFTDVSGSGPWANPNSDIIGHVIDACEKVRRLTGLMPKKLAIGRVLLNHMLKNTGIKAQFPGAPLITRAMLEQALPAIFGLRELLVGDEVYDSAGEGASSSSITDIWGDTYASVLYTAEAGEGLEAPCVGRTMVWTDYQAEIYGAETYREEQSESDVVRVKSFTDELIYDPSYAHLLQVKA